MKLIPIDFTHSLVADAKLNALFRFVKWQLKSRALNRDFIHEWIEGSKFFVRNGETGLTQNIYVGLHEFSEMSFLLHFLRKDDVFLDVGANSGAYSILAGTVCRAKVLAFEPIPSTYSRLVANLDLNGLFPRCVTRNIGLGSSESILYMTENLDTMNQVTLEHEHSKSIPIQINTLDNESRDIEPSLVKIDVEGWETEVLRGSRELLNKSHLASLIVELNESGIRYGFKDSGIIELLGNCGFKPFAYDPIDRKLTRLEYKNYASGNTIFIREKVLNGVEGRLRATRKLKVFNTWL